MTSCPKHCTGVLVGISGTTSWLRRSLIVLGSSYRGTANWFVSLPLCTCWEASRHPQRILRAWAHHDEMAAPSKPAQKTARAVEGPRAGAAGNQARVHGERRRGAELDRNL